MKIILTESQERLLYKHILNEYMQNGFNLKTLYNMNPFDEEDGFYYPQRLRDYCVKYIGEPMNDGSSREVFDLNDNRVLKLAHNKTGIEQNKVEYDIWSDSKSPLLPSILAHSREFAWIITEQVIPCNKSDFEKILGIPYDYAYLRYQKEDDKLERKQYKNYNNKKLPSNKEICYDGFLVFLSDFLDGVYIDYDDDDGVNQYYLNLLKQDGWFKELYKLIKKYHLEPLDIDLRNLGIALRNGIPTIVILDSGLNNEVCDKYY